MKRVLIVYLGLAAGFAFSGVRSIFDGQVVMGGLLCLFSLYLVQGVFRSRGLSAASEVLRASVQHVDVHRPRPPLTRGYFVVHFVENGEPRKRLIMLPGSLAGGRSEFEKAIRVLKTAGLLKTRAE